MWTTSRVVESIILLIHLLLVSVLGLVAVLWESKIVAKVSGRVQEERWVPFLISRGQRSQEPGS